MGGNQMTKFIFVTGGVVSSLGKGIAAACIGALLKARGFKVRNRKLDPYLNIDPGTMSPHQHGEVFVTDDGAETDLDLGHYERFVGESLKKTDSISGGRIYYNVLMNERHGDYLGGTVQAIPHVTDEIKRFIASDLTDEDFVICEIGGTVGDIEGLIFLEAIRQFANDVGRENALFIHLTLLPYIEAAGELKTKPTQHSIKTLLEAGIQADMILCRSVSIMSQSERSKLALFCNIKPEDVITALNVDNIYKIPLVYHKEGLDERVLYHFGMLEDAAEPDLSKWHSIEQALSNRDKTVKIAIVGKYCGLQDAYKSLNEALLHAGLANKAKVDITWIEAETLENLSKDKVAEKLRSFDSVLIPGGFGVRGVEGKIAAITYARENNIPCLGICLGMQSMAIEAARNVLGIADANSTEFSQKCTPVISLMSEWEKDGKKQTRTEKTDKGGTLRLGAYPCRITKGTLADKIYGQEVIYERHRHRYEMDMSFENSLNEKGYIISGKSPDGILPEIIELKGHPFFIGVQFHPEFKSRPFEPHLLFNAFIQASLQKR
jgi:CTP synthase